MSALVDHMLVQDALVAFQGEPGAYSEQAIYEYIGPGARSYPCASFEEVFAAVSQGQCALGMLPIENSLAGSIHRNYDLMLEHQLSIVGEYHLRVRHCLLALPGVQLADVRRVFSHPQALSQCLANLKRMGLQPVPQADTAGSARLVQETQDRQAGVLASRRAAEVYGMHILAQDMEDNPANFTRFLALSAHPLPDPSLEGIPPSNQKQPGSASGTTRLQAADYKTSIVFTLRNHPGALFRAMSVFALRDIDLTKIESRPLPGKPWEYIFYIDFVGHARQQDCMHALDNLGEWALMLRVLGSYPRHSY
jgi:prephenate dehydratase